MRKVDPFRTTDGLLLSGVWSLPRPEVAVKAIALILPGSGNIDSGGDLSGSIVGESYDGQPARLSDQLADCLAALGVAAYRFDKRGFEDPSRLAQQTPEFQLRDADAALKKMRTEFPSIPLLLIGFSEGALIALSLRSLHETHSLFLLGCPTRPIDQMLAYQYFEWPLRLLAGRLDPEGSGKISHSNLVSALMPTGFLPLMQSSWDDSAIKDEVSLELDLVPVYQRLHDHVMSLMEAPPFSSWFESFQRFSHFTELAAQTVESVHFYYGLLDAQINVWVALTDVRAIRGSMTLRLFPGLGHCFSPMKGPIGQAKTSGPLMPTLLEQLAADVQDRLSA